MRRLLKERDAHVTYDPQVAEDLRCESFRGSWTSHSDSEPNIFVTSLVARWLVMAGLVGSMRLNYPNHVWATLIAAALDPGKTPDRQRKAPGGFPIFFPQSESCSLLLHMLSLSSSILMSCREFSNFDAKEA